MSRTSSSYDLVAIAEGLESQAAKYARMCAFSELGVSHRDITIQNVLASLEVARIFRAMAKETGGDRTAKAKKL